MDEQRRLNISKSKKEKNRQRDIERLNRLLLTISKDEFENYYRNHNGADTIKWCKEKFSDFYSRDYEYLLNYWNIRRRSTIETNNIKISKMRENYGVTNNFQRKEIKDKCKQIKKDRYGDEWYSNREKAMNTTLEIYGTLNMLGLDKTKDTIYKRYGNIDSMYKVSAESRKKYYLDNFGVSNPSQVPEIQSKMKKRYSYNDMYFDSAPELALWIYAIAHNQDIVRGKDVGYFEYTFNNETHRYYPDFIYNGKFIELKGKQFFKEDGTMCNPYDHSQDDLYEAKHQCGIKNNVEFWSNDDYKFAIDWCIENKINLKEFRNWR